MDFKYILLTNDSVRKFRPFIIPQLFDRLQFEGMVMIGALDTDHIPCGFMAIRCDERGFAELIWIFVSKNYRLYGCGRGFIEYVRPLLKEAGIEKFYGLSAVLKGMDDGLLERFYKSFDVKISLLNDHFVTMDAHMLREKFDSYTGSAGSLCGYLDEVDKSFLKKAYNSFDESVRKRLEPAIKRANGDIAKAFETCSVICTCDDKISGILLFYPSENKEGIVLVAMKSSSANVLADMLMYSLKRGVRIHGENLKMTFASLNNIGESLGKYFGAKDWAVVKAYEFL